MTKFDVVGFGALNVDMLFKPKGLRGLKKKASLKIILKHVAAPLQTLLWGWRGLVAKLVS